MPDVVFLTCHLPYPPTSGGRLREYELIRRLADEFRMHVVAISKTPAEDVRNAARLRRLGVDVTILPAVPEAGHGIAPHQVQRHASPVARRVLSTLCVHGAAHVVHVEGFYLAQHVPPTRCPTLLVEQNAEFELWRQRAALGDAHAEREAALTLEAEREAWRSAAIVATVTDDDRSALLAEEPALDVRVVPDGADHLSTPAARDRDPGTVVFVANFGYAPNVDAALYLLREIWPDVRARALHARLRLVGGGVPPELSAAAAGDARVEVTGRVPAVAPFLDTADVVVAPLRVGGGVKVKVLEALSRGSALVTTSVGAQGLGDGVRRAAVVVDDPSRFADSIVRLLFDGPGRRLLQRSAAEFARTLPTWDESAATLASIYRELAAVTTEKTHGVEAASTTAATSTPAPR